MCGNFGLILLQKRSKNETNKKREDISTTTRELVLDELDRSLNKSIYNAANNVRPADDSVHSLRAVSIESMRKVSQINRIRLNVSVHDPDEDDSEFDYDAPKEILSVKQPLNRSMLPILKIIKAQTSSTEIRGGQAGGVSCMEYTPKDLSILRDNSKSSMDHYQPITTRVRCVGRRRYSLASYLTKLFKQTTSREPSTDSTITVLGHTRFATSSFNRESELHPHEWTPFRDETVWSFHSFTFKKCRVGIHISHNGDFDALDMYGQKMVVGDVGLWLERVLHVPNSLRGDSPKIAGCFDLFCVQGRWAAAARLAFLRCVTSAPSDVCGNIMLSKDAMNTFPGAELWAIWERFFSEIWMLHVNNVIKTSISMTKYSTVENQFTIDMDGEKQLRSHLEQAIAEVELGDVSRIADVKNWKICEQHAFIYHTVRGFLRADLYNAMTEILTRAEGSFGLQAHCTLEPGVVVLASKGQPMSVAFDPKVPLCLFGSEAEAVAVPVEESGRWLPQRLDLDSRGEIMRVGYPRLLVEGGFVNNHEKPLKISNKSKNKESETSKSSTSAQKAEMFGGNHSQSLEYPCAKKEEYAAQKSHSVSLSSSDQPHASEMSQMHANTSIKNKEKEIPLKTESHSTFTSNPVVSTSKKTDMTSSQKIKNHEKSLALTLAASSLEQCLSLDCGVEIRVYSLLTSMEATKKELLARVIDVLTSPVPYEPDADLVEGDLFATPAIINRIDEAWNSRSTHEYQAAEDLCNRLLVAMRARQSVNKDSIDLLVGGVEASLWIAEQWASDLRALFPFLNVVTQSTNKLMGLEGDSPGKIFFSGCESTSWRRIDSTTCVLLISQSGQTFPTLHATRECARLVGDRLWVLTGCFHSKMEQVLHEVYNQRKMQYGENRVFNNYSGNCPAEPTSVAAAATHHTLTRLMLQLIETTAIYMNMTRSVHMTNHTTKFQSKLRALEPSQSETSLGILKASSVDSIASKQSATSRTRGVCFAAEQSGIQHDHDDFVYAEDLEECTNISLEVDLDNLRSDPSALSPSRRVSFPGFDPASSSISDTPNEADKNTDSALIPVDTVPASCTESRKDSVSTHVNEYIDNSKPLMTLSLSCVQDARALLTATVIPGLESIVGADRNMKPLLAASLPTGSVRGEGDESIHSRLVKQGQTWAKHVKEPWEVLVIVAAYLIVSIGLGIPLFAVLASILHWIVIAATRGAVGGEGSLSFSLLHSEIISSQPAIYTLLGLIIQCADAVFYVYVAKMFTWGSRWVGGRPMWARHGRRTLVVVDSPMVHQLTENFVSKLFSQAYSFCGLDVHGANGLDHFVHRFTHRVCRGVLIAVGRPDGRLCCLAKSEAAILLATKQAAFIENSDYHGAGSGPDIITVGHNSFQPNVGYSKHLVIPGTRGAFLDEIVFEQLSGHPKAGEAVQELLHRLFMRIRTKRGCMAGKLYGLKVIENFVLEAFVRKFQRSESQIPGKLHKGAIRRSEETYDPSASIAFISKLDSHVQTLLRLQRPLQQLYEGRVAALERYISFCVIFHAMAKECSHPWFRSPWDIARSQSNLRVATTASPVAVFETGSGQWTRETHNIARQMARRLKGFQTHM